MTVSRNTRRGWSLLSASILIIALCLVLIQFYEPVDAQTNKVTFPVGLGFTDVISHQIVRTSTDHVYIFAGQAQYSKVLAGYWTTAAGLPTATNNFNGTTTITEASNIIAVDAVYDGNTTIHVILLTVAGAIIDHPFNTATNTFHTAISIATNGGTIVAGDYLGTSGVSGMIDLSGRLHVSYWAATNHIIHRVYTYAPATNTLTPVTSATQVDTNGAATHPAVAVSPLDNSVTIAWVSQVNAPTGDILTRTRSSAGVWGSIEKVSTSDAWTSATAGVNIDEGPSLLIGANGTKYLMYIEDTDLTHEYGRIHLVTFNGGWTDSVIAISGTDPVVVINGSTYSHDPALAINSGGQLYIIGHGPEATGANVNMYTVRRNLNGTWAIPALYISPTNTNSFDASASVKWSVVGNNRPNSYEFVYFVAMGGNYNQTKLYYGRFDDAAIVVNTPAAPSRNYFKIPNPLLTWNRLSWATAYRIEVASTNTYGTSMVFTSTVGTEVLSATPSNLTNGVYFWHVQAQKPDGTWSAFSASESFTVALP